MSKTITTALLILASGLTLSTTALAEPFTHGSGYVNYRNYDEGPESLAAFRAYHRARSRAAIRPESGIPSAAGARGAASLSDRNATAVGEHCDLAPRVGFQNSTSDANC